MVSVRNQLIPTSFKPQTLNKSKGIFDDYAVRKNLATREGTIRKVPVAAIDIVNKEYVDSRVLAQDSYVGSDCSGTDGQTNRTLDMGVASAMIYVDTQFLHPTSQYSVAGTVITFLIPIWDTHKITTVHL